MSEVERLHEPIKPILPWFLRKPPRYERPNIAFVGLRGQGKTLEMVEFALRRLRGGEAVLANINIVDARNPARRAIRITSWDMVLDWTNDRVADDCTIVIDEAPLWMDCRKWNDAPGEIRAYWRQSRHHGVGFLITAQNFEDIDKNMRDLLDMVVVCEKVKGLPARMPMYSYKWAYPEDFKLIEQGRAPKLNRTFRWVPADVFASYSTEELVVLQDWKEYRERMVEGGQSPSTGGV